MKKILLLVVLFSVVSVVAAQKRERDHKDHSAYLPKKGDLATGVDLVGMAKFLGNTMSPKVEGAAVAPFGGDIFVKYFLTNNIALRARLGVGVDNGTRRESVLNDAAYLSNNLSTSTLIDEEKRKNSNFNFGVGAEFRKGIRRVQGYVGAELFYTTGSQKLNYTHGNAMTKGNKNPSTALGLTSYSDPYYISRARYLERSYSSRSTGIALLTGVDYFISRSISLGFEFSLAGVGASSKPNRIVYERWVTTSEWDEQNPNVDMRQEITIDSPPKQNSFSIAPTGRANLMFYF